MEKATEILKLNLKKIVSKKFLKTKILNPKKF